MKARREKHRINRKIDEALRAEKRERGDHRRYWWEGVPYIEDTRDNGLCRVTFHPIYGRCWTPIGRDNCTACAGASGGVRGNENLVYGLVVCDYCTAKVQQIVESCVDSWVAASDWVLNGGMTQRATPEELRTTCVEMLLKGELPQLRKQIETEMRAALRPREE